MNPEALQDQLVGRAGWVCPTCVVRSITVRGDDQGLTIAITHDPRCSAAAMWLLEPPPPADNPDAGSNVERNREDTP